MTQLPAKQKLLMPLPSDDFDPTEVAVTWDLLRQKDFNIIFATPDGKPSAGDVKMVTGASLGILKPLLMAKKTAVNAYCRLIESVEFKNPMIWNNIEVSEFDGVILPGGHAPGMKPYLESTVLQNKVVDFFQSNKLVAAICHGTVLVARSKGPDGKSVLFGYKTTGLLKSQELTAWGLTVLYLGDYYRTYPETVQDEVTRNLEKKEDFVVGPFPVKRDSPENMSAGFVIRDRNYISARWPGDVHNFAMTISRYFNE